MNAVSPETPTGDWNGLRRVEATLPSAFYTDAAHFQLELQKTGDSQGFAESQTKPE